MAFHSDLWVTTATVASAILVATAVAITQSLSTMVERAREQHTRNTVSSRRWLRDRRASLARSYVSALTSIVLTVLALFVSMLSLLYGHDVAPPWLGAIPVLAGAVLIFVQVLLTANVRLLEVRGLASEPPDDGAV